MIKQTLKKILPNKFIQRIKVGKDIIYYNKVIKSIPSEKVDNIYIIGSAIHTNLGDHLITMGETDFLKEIFPNRKIIEIPTEVYQIYKEKLINSIPKEALIVINGGGWMGNIWIKEELLIQDIVSSFYENRVIIFPQTIYYSQDIEPYDDLIVSARKSFEKCPKLLLTVRDEQSYLFARKYYPKTKSILVPDIGLYYYGKKEYSRNTNKKVFYCLRDDREISRSGDIIKQVKSILEQKGFIQGKINTMYKNRVSEFNRRKVVETRLTDFSEASLVVTDRLHGMIFSFIAGVPCMILDNSTKKVSGVYKKWLKDSGYILPLYDNISEQKIIQFLDSVDLNKKKNYKIEFSELKEEIIHG